LLASSLTAAGFQIADAIKQNNIQQNWEAAMENNPEAFGRVVMLYVPVIVNKVGAHSLRARPLTAAGRRSGACVGLRGQRSAEHDHERGLRQALQVSHVLFAL
jgi:hypothetical protein